MKKLSKKILSGVLCFSLLASNSSAIFAQTTLNEGTLADKAIEVFIEECSENTNYDIVENNEEVETLDNETNEELSLLDSKIEEEIGLLDSKINEKTVEDVRTLTFDGEEFELIGSDIEEENNILMLDEMSEEAKKIYLFYISTQDEELLNYYKTYINPDSVLEYTPNCAVYASVRAVDALSVLRTELNYIGLSTSVVNAFVAAGSSIVAALADGPLLAGDIAAILTGAVCFGVVLTNWSTVSKNWTEITKAFTKAFSAQITSSALSSGLSRTQTKYATTYSDLKDLRNEVRGANYNSSAARHIEMDAVKTIVRRDIPLAIYASTVNSRVLCVYRIGSGTKADVNKDFVHRGSESSGKYQLPKLDISGAKLFVLYNKSTKKVFHAHIRFFVDDTHQMRYTNGLDLQVYPVWAEDKQYRRIGSDDLTLPGNIYSKQ